MENGRSSPYVDWFHLNPEWLKEGRQLRAFDEHAHVPSALTALSRL